MSLNKFNNLHFCNIKSNLIEAELCAGGLLGVAHLPGGAGGGERARVRAAQGPAVPGAGGGRRLPGGRPLAAALAAPARPDAHLPRPPELAALLAQADRLGPPRHAHHQCKKHRRRRPAITDSAHSLEQPS